MPLISLVCLDSQALVVATQACFVMTVTHWSVLLRLGSTLTLQGVELGLTIDTEG